MIKKIIIGVLTSLGLLTLLVMIGAGVLFWMLSSEENGLPERMILTLDLRSGINEASDSSSLAALDLGQQLTLAETILAIEHAGRQKGVAGLIAKIDGGGPGFAQSQELRQAISQFRNQGKFAWAYSTSFGEFGPGTLGYYLATAFEEVHLQPLGAVGLTGLYLETPLLQGLFEQVGVKPSGDKRGAYKSAANMFTENSLTDEHRENLDWLATSLDEQIRAGIAKGRDLTTETVGELIDGGPYSAEEAFDNRLVDRLSYWDELLAQAMEKAGSEAELISLKAFASAVHSDIASDQVVALIEGVGQIQQGDSSNGPGGWVMGSDTVAEAITDAIDDSEVRAILLRVDSGGGSAVASETIGRAVRRAIEMKKPVIVSMGNVAASGGYWIAMDATAIVADPGTLTGSIGVLA
ncbi:MAG: S49 family peptidase, partial [Geminicoccaceae bacterium]